MYGSQSLLAIMSRFVAIITLKNNMQYSNLNKNEKCTVRSGDFIVIVKVIIRQGSIWTVFPNSFCDDID